MSNPKEILVGLCTINRPKTTRRALEALMLSDGIEKVRLIIVDNNSNEETKKVIQSFQKYPSFIDEVIYNEWNTGVAFGVNRWLSLREPQEHCIQMDADCILISKDWVKIFLDLIGMKDAAVVAAHRASAWIDKGNEKLDFFRNQIMPEKRMGTWCELARNNLIITPFMMYKNTLIDHLGYENEATLYDDIDWAVRVNCTGLKSMYATEVLIQQPDDEVQEHPQYESYRELMSLRERVHQRFVDGYVKNATVTLGTRFLPNTMTDEYYNNLSDANWDFLKEWRR